MFFNTNDWYIDSMDIERNLEEVNNGVTTQKLVTIANNIPCRIYRKSNSSTTIKEMSAEMSLNDNLICDINVDIKAGDTLYIKKSFFIDKWNGIISKYVAGEPVDYNTPIGGYITDIEHKQLSITSVEVNS